MSWRRLLGGGATFVVLLLAGVADAATINVHMKDIAFKPELIAVNPGDTLIFINDDEQLHSVLLPDKETLLAENFIDPGKSLTISIPPDAEPGAYNLVCTVHVDMKGTIKILAK